MRRRTFDTLMSAGGAVVTIVLLVSGALLFVGYNFANNNVKTQLSEQKITMPSGPAIQDPRIQPYLAKYAGQPMTNGAQAEAYANHFIKVHVSDTGKGTPYAGMTYAQLGTYQRAHSEDTTVTQARETVFKGETLRGLLLNAYAFWKVGQIALLAGIASFALAGVMAILTVLGFWHLRRVPEEEEFLAPHGAVHAAA